MVLKFFSSHNMTKEFGLFRSYFVFRHSPLLISSKILLFVLFDTHGIFIIPLINHISAASILFSIVRVIVHTSHPYINIGCWWQDRRCIFINLFNINFRLL